MMRNERLPLKIAQRPHDCTAGTVRRLALSWDSLANFNDHLAAALHMNVRLSYEHRTAALHSVWIYMGYVQIRLRSASRSLSSVALGNITQTNDCKINVKQTLLL